MAGDKTAYVAVKTDEKVEDKKPIPVAPKGFGARHVQAFILFLCLTAVFTVRAQLSVSMVAMTTSVEGNHMQNDSISYNTTQSRHDGMSKWNVYRTYDWHTATQEMITFSFFVGYTSMNLPMGIVAQKIGGKIPILVGLAVNGVVSLITPWVPIFGGWVGLSLCRFLQGATQAAFYPSMHTILGKWAPLSERARLSTYIYSGSPFGTIVIFQISGFFAGSPTFGWPATFWFCGVLSLVCFGLIWKLGAATPQEHPTISVDELVFIMGGGSSDVVPKKRETPWKSILTSKAVWGLVISHAGSTAGYLLILTQMPTYMNYVLGVNIKKNGLFSSLPYGAMYFTALLFGYLADYAANKQMLSVANIRRIANTTGMVVSGLCFIGFSFITSITPAVIVLILTMVTHSAIQVGFHINHIDIAPNFAGPIMGLGNTIANLLSLLVPVVVSNIVKEDMKNQSRWQIVFLIFMGFQFLANTIFVIFVKGTVQPWNFYGEEIDITAEEELSEKPREKKELDESNEVLTKT